MRARPPNQPQKEKDSKAPNYIKQRRRTGTTPNRERRGMAPTTSENLDKPPSHSAEKDSKASEGVGGLWPLQASSEVLTRVNGTPER